ncbi:SRPBCC family protein [Streptomyces sp. SPB074]|uniref:SRPBCC family protein n=1 Tax=Streptomyces sp. (strain SPB074) TaxID=465543 RepID=UPI00017F264A|nr:SRPBCC family protein [Streptomyces sp. SPB074]
MASSLLEAVDIKAPVEVSWGLWENVKRWPAFLSHVKHVHRADRNTFVWQLGLPGADEEFTAELTEVVPGERIAWHTTGGVRHAGVVTFHRLSDTESRVTLQIEYEPEGFIEHLGALTNLDATLANYDLGEFQKLAEVEAGTRKDA